MRRGLRGDIATRFVSALARHYQRAHDIEAGLRAFHAPSECYRDAFRGYEQREVELRRLYRRLAGMNNRTFRRAVASRVSPKCAQRLGI